MKRLKDFWSIRRYFSIKEIEDLQATVDARRRARLGANDGSAPADGETSSSGAGVRARRIL